MCQPDTFNLIHPFAHLQIQQRSPFPPIAAVMAEAIGLAAGIVGATDVCFRTFSALADYSDTLRNRQVDFNRLTRLALDVQRYLPLLCRVTGRQNPRLQAEVFEVESHLRRCQAELNVLVDFLTQMRADYTASGSLLEKVKAGSKRLSYPFSKAKLEELERRLEQCISRLTAALHLPQL